MNQDDIIYTNSPDIGLDLDSDTKQLKGYRYALNCRHGSTDTGHMGCIENMPGNTLVEFELPEGENVEIGACRDIKRNSIIYFIANSEGNHRILRYFIDTNTIESCFNPSYTSFGALNFSSGFRIHTADIVYYLTGELLFWTDNNNQPRKINLTRALDGGYDDIDEQTLNAIKYPPTAPLTCVLGTDTSIKTNLIKGILWQFRYNYVYDDNENSVFSTISKVVLPTLNESLYGEFPNNGNNKITLSFSAGHNTVKRIQIAARAGNIGNWKLVDQIDRDEAWVDFSTHTVDFYNDKLIRMLNAKEAETPFHYVPYKALLQKFVQNNRLIYLNYEEGQDNVEIDVSVAVINDTISAQAYKLGRQYSANEDTVDNAFALYIGKAQVFEWEWFLRISAVADLYALYIPQTLGGMNNIAAGNIITFQLILNDTAVIVSVPISYTVTSADIAAWTGAGTPTTLVDNIVLAANTALSVQELSSPLNGNYPLFENAGSTVLGGGNTIDGAAHTYWAVQLAAISIDPTWTYTPCFLRVSQPVTNQVGFKRGATHKLGIEYGDDAGRFGFIQTNADSKIYVPSLVEDFPGGNMRHTAHLEYTINSLPPENATWYQVMYGGCNVSFWLQAILSLMPDTSIITQLSDLSNSGSRTYIELSSLKNFDTLMPENTLEYTWQEGDRIRFITQWVKDSVTTLDKNILSNVIDVEIYSYDAATNIMEVGKFDYIANKIGPYSLVEVYRPNPNSNEENAIWVEIGERYAITNGFHMGNTQDQTGAQPAIVTLTRGNCYVKPRSYWGAFPSMANTTPRPYFSDRTWTDYVEAMNWSDFYPSDDFDYGRPNVINKDAEKATFTGGMRYSEVVLENTPINGLCEFLANSEQTLPNKYGGIYGVKEVGFVLKVIQQKKLTSIYLGRTSSFNPDGTEQIILTDSFIGTKRPSDDEFGTIYPDSVLEVDGRVYFFDVYLGKYIRNTSNGNFPISDYLVSTFFKNKSLALKSSGLNNTSVVSFWDEINGFAHVAFRDRSEGAAVPYEVISFHEQSNRWKSFQPFYQTTEDGLFYPEHFFHNGQACVAFLKGSLHLHNNGTFGTYFGSKYPQIITPVSAQYFGQNKVFDSMWINSNKRWGVENISIPATILYPLGMRSRLLVTDFEAEEEKFVAAFKSDMNTPGFTNEVLALNNGSVLRGQEILLRMRNDEDVLVKLFSISVITDISP